MSTAYENNAISFSGHSADEELSGPPQQKGRIYVELKTIINEENRQ